MSTTSAAQRAVGFAREHVQQHLPDEVAFLVFPNQSFDENARIGDEVVFPDDSLPEGQDHGPWRGFKRAAIHNMSLTGSRCHSLGKGKSFQQRSLREAQPLSTQALCERQNWLNFALFA